MGTDSQPVTATKSVAKHLFSTAVNVARILQKVDVVFTDNLTLLLGKDPFLLLVYFIAYIIFTFEDKGHLQNLIELFVDDVILEVATGHERCHNLNHELIIVVVAPLEVGVPDAGSGRSLELEVTFEQREERLEKEVLHDSGPIVGR